MTEKHTYWKPKGKVWYQKNDDSKLGKQKTKITKEYAEYLDAKYGLDAIKSGKKKGIYVEKGDEGYESGAEVI